MGIFLLCLLATWAHEYMALFVNIEEHRKWGRFKRAGGMLVSMSMR